MSNAVAPNFEPLRAMHLALCSELVEEAAFRAALGGSRGDLGTVLRYAAMPVDRRPALSPYFDAAFYLATNPEVAAEGWDPLLHFIESGFAQLRAPHPLIDLQFITDTDAHILGRPRTMAALVDLLNYDLASPGPYFDPGRYWAGFRQGQGGGGLRHYLDKGLAANVRPNAMLDPAWYAERHEDSPSDPLGALRHFVLIGDQEGRASSPEFDGVQYWTHNPDVHRAGARPLRHYLTNGRAESRKSWPARAVVAWTPEFVQDPLKPAVVDQARGQAEYDAIRHRAPPARTSQLVPPPLCRSKAPVADLARLSFPAVPLPKVSILIPVFDELRYTVECLMALLQARPSVPFEVVIADDASGEPGFDALRAVPNLRVVRQAQTTGFLRNCNAAFLQCRGRYVLLLNNDTQVQPGAVERMAAVLDEAPGVGAVGAKLIYPDGVLQEAGCALRRNGESIMVGLNGHPDDPSACYDRDVAYCSAAALMVRREPIGDTLFNPDYAPSYCEDADLCLRLMGKGYRIRYAHAAVVVHHMSVSSNRGSVQRKMRGILRNQQRLAERWGPALRRLDDVRALAFYLPQFHPVPQNDLWWGKGFTEWTNVAKARPGFAGHGQPQLPADLGYYDLRSGETLRAQAELAARYGIEGFCVYYYNFGGTQLLSRPIEAVRADPSIPFHWCLCWANENWTRRWDGGDGSILAEQRYDAETLRSVIQDVVSQAADPRYIRVDGCPVFLVYRPALLPRPARFAAMCRSSFAEAGLPGVHLVAVESMERAVDGVTPASIGFDAAVEFPPHGVGVLATGAAPAARDGWSGLRYSYPATVSAALDRPRVPYRRYGTVFPAWDNTARQPNDGTVVDLASPEAFRAYVEDKLQDARRHLLGHERLLFINAWNEWAEGAHMEPDLRYGHRWLEAFRDAVEAVHA